ECGVDESAGKVIVLILSGKEIADGRLREAGARHGRADGANPRGHGIRWLVGDMMNSSRSRGGTPATLTLSRDPDRRQGLTREDGRHAGTIPACCAVRSDVCLAV